MPVDNVNPRLKLVALRQTKMAEFNSSLRHNYFIHSPTLICSCGGDCLWSNSNWAAVDNATRKERSVRPFVTAVKTYFAWRRIYVLSAEFSTQICINIHESGVGTAKRYSR